jgi:hypothetical protein
VSHRQQTCRSAAARRLHQLPAVVVAAAAAAIHFKLTENSMDGRLLCSTARCIQTGSTRAQKRRKGRKKYTQQVAAWSVRDAPPHTCASLYTSPSAGMPVHLTTAEKGILQTVGSPVDGWDSEFRHQASSHGHRRPGGGQVRETRQRGAQGAYAAEWQARVKRGASTARRAPRRVQGGGQLHHRK